MGLRRRLWALTGGRSAESQEGALGGEELIALDTNVLVRFLVRDDESQADALETGRARLHLRIGARSLGELVELAGIEPATS